MTVTVSVVVPTYLRSRALQATLAALVTSDWPSHCLEIVVVDDGSDRATRAAVDDARGHDVPLRYLALERRGAATARNYGARMASGDVLLFCDDDVIVKPDHVRRHIAARERHGDPLVNGVSTLVQSALADFGGTPFGRFRLDLEAGFEREADGESLGDGRYSTQFVSARNLAVGRELFWELGGFDEGFPHAGAEDQDLSLRARAAGCLLIRDHGIRVDHNEQTLTLAQFCTREEHSAQTLVVLAIKYPSEGEGRAIYVENRYVRRGDGTARIVKKRVKWLLSRGPVLQALLRLSAASEHLPMPEPMRRRIYEGLIGAHIFRGVRTGLERASRIGSG